METIESTFFEVSAKSKKVLDTGQEKTVTEIYAVEALSFTEAEAKAISFFRKAGLKEFEIKNINPVPYKTIYVEDKENDEMAWFKAKWAFVTLDEQTGAEKYSNVVCLIQAEDFDSALTNLNKAMKGTMQDWKTFNLQATKIVQIVVK